MSVHFFHTINSFRENYAKENKIAGMVTICARLQNAGTKIFVLATTHSVRQSTQIFTSVFKCRHRAQIDNSIHLTAIG
jgi:hypothetical protein